MLRQDIYANISKINYFYKYVSCPVHAQYSKLLFKKLILSLSGRPWISRTFTEWYHFPWSFHTKFSPKKKTPYKQDFRQTGSFFSALNGSIQCLGNLQLLLIINLFPKSIIIKSCVCT